MKQLIKLAEQIDKLLKEVREIKISRISKQKIKVELFEAKQKLRSLEMINSKIRTNRQTIEMYKLKQIIPKVELKIRMDSVKTEKLKLPMVRQKYFKKHKVLMKHNGKTLVNAKGEKLYKTVSTEHSRMVEYKPKVKESMRDGKKVYSVPKNYVKLIEQKLGRSKVILVK